jgi:two-component system, NarL family, nitrate/nitrite response regulator NarL
MPKGSSTTQHGKDDNDASPTDPRGDHENSSQVSIIPSGGTGPTVPTALICDNSLLHSGLQSVLAGTPFMIAEESPATGPRLVSEEAHEPLLCIQAVSQLSSRSLEVVRQVKERHPAARIVVLADHIDLALVAQGRGSGIDGFCLTASSREVLITTLKLVMLGERVLPGVLVRSILDNMALSPELGPQESNDLGTPRASEPGVRSITAREAEILRCLMDGAPNKLIARKLDVAEATVKVHVKAILRKIGVANRTQAAMWAMDHLAATGEASLHG